MEKGGFSTIYHYICGTLQQFGIHYKKGKLCLKCKALPFLYELFLHELYGRWLQLKCSNNHMMTKIHLQVHHDTKISSVDHMMLLKHIL